MRLRLSIKQAFKTYTFARMYGASHRRARKIALRNFLKVLTGWAPL